MGEDQIMPVLLPEDFGANGPRDAEIMRGAFRYQDGRLFWIARPAGNLRVGAEAGYETDKGYRNICIGGKTYASHRIIWLMHKDEWAPLIDHINRDTRNSRIENLRKATKAENCRNAKRRTDNTSGYKGVSFRRRHNTYQALIDIDGKRTTVGSFKTAEEAHEAYKAAGLKHYGEFFNAG